MKNQKPPFEITNKIIDYVSDISQLLGALCAVSPATANRILAEFAAEGKLVKYRDGGHWAYRKL